MTASGDHQQWTRREFIITASSGSFAGILSGCSTNQEFEFGASPTSVRQANSSGFGHTLDEEIVQTRTISSGDVSATAELRSHFSQYEALVITSSGEPIGEYTLSVLSSPAGEVLGQSINPMGNISIADLVAGRVGAEFFGETRFGEHGGHVWAAFFGNERFGEHGGHVWGQSPTTIYSQSARLEQEETNVETFAGFTSDELVSLISATKLVVDQDLLIVALFRSWGSEPDEVGLLPNPRVDTGEVTLLPNPKLDIDDVGLLPNPKLNPGEVGLIPHPRVGIGEVEVQPHPYFGQDQLLSPKEVTQFTQFAVDVISRIEHPSVEDGK